MIQELRKWLILALVGLALILACLGVSRCSKSFQQPTIGPRIDSIIVVRHDTINRIDTVLKKRVIYRDTGRIEYIHDDLDKVVPPIGNENVCIAENQLRQCMKCQDSLEAFKLKSSIDSQTIDTLSKLAKTVPDTIKIKPPITQRLKDAGIGFLLGVATRSFF